LNILLSERIFPKLRQLTRGSRKAISVIYEQITFFKTALFECDPWKPIRVKFAI
jgi:hypothetical protein